MSAEDFESEGRLKRRIISIAVIVGIFGLGAAFVLKSPSEPPKKKAKPVEIVAITPLPLPLPPPPPPPPEPEEAPEPEEPEELAEEEPVDEPETPGPEEPPDEALGTGLTGEGSNGFGLSNRGDGRRGNGGGGGTGGNARAAFLRGVSTTLQAELKRHPALKNATYDVTLNVRVSGDGRVLSITPQPSTGDPSLDRILSSEFVGVRFPQAPPSGKAGVVKTRAKSSKPRA